MREREGERRREREGEGEKGEEKAGERGREKAEKSSIVSLLFGGKYESELICHSCHTSSFTSEVFYDLSLR